MCNAVDEAPDVIYTGARIWTGNAEQPWAEALAVRAGRVLSAGPAARIEALRQPGTRVVALDGCLVVPGFIDNHTHFLGGGFQLASVDLRDADTPEEFARRLGAFAATVPEGRWITGGDWDHERWGGALPRRDWVDSLTAHHPVFVSRLDGHMALANSRALVLAGVQPGTPDPEGGTLVRDPDTGEPTGILKDEAMALVGRVIPDPSEEALDEALDRAMAHALARGVTQVHDMGSLGGWTDLETYRRAQEAGRLQLRIYAFVPLATWERLDAFIQEHGRGDDWLRWGGLKGFVDGSLGSTTAWFYAPYDDEPETAGLVVTDTTTLRERIVNADAKGLHLAVHAIGDRANDWLLDAFAEAARRHGPRDRRFRIEHAQHLSADAVARFAGAGVIPSMQPYHAIEHVRVLRTVVGGQEKFAAAF